MSISLREKIAQMLCFGFDGAYWSEAKELKDWLSSSDGLGWLIEFDYDCHRQAYEKNILSIEQLQNLNHDIKSYYASRHPQGLPIALSIDVEGGKVDRLARLSGYQRLPSAFALASSSPEERERAWVESAQFLKSLHFDLNFSPVVDLNLSPDEGIFGPYERCFSENPQKVCELAQEYIQILQKHGLMACLKHFPGHGSARDDSHKGFVDVTSSFQQQELIPYQLLIEKQNLVQCIMTAHVINRELDATGKPATLSKKMIREILRNQYHYQGLVISDDLQMYAIAKYFSKEDAIAQAIEAGADVLMFCNQLGFDTPKDVIDIIERLISEKRIDIHLIECAFERIKHYKTLMQKSFFE